MHNTPRRAKNVLDVLRKKCPSVSFKSSDMPYTSKTSSSASSHSIQFVHVHFQFKQCWITHFSMYIYPTLSAILMANAIKGNVILPRQQAGSCGQKPASQEFIDFAKSLHSPNSTLTNRQEQGGYNFNVYANVVFSEQSSRGGFVSVSRLRLQLPNLPYSQATGRKCQKEHRHHEQTLQQVRNLIHPRWHEVHKPEDVGSRPRRRGNEETTAPGELRRPEPVLHCLYPGWRLWILHVSHAWSRQKNRGRRLGKGWMRDACPNCAWGGGLDEGRHGYYP